MTGPVAARPDAIRRHNLCLVLAEVHRLGNTSRAALTQSLGLNRSTIGALVTDLAEHGLVRESAPLTRTGAGRPSHVVGPRPDGPYVIAVDVDVHRMEAAAVGLAGGVLGRRSLTYPDGPVSPDYIADQILDAFAALRRTLPDGSWAVGVGVSVPGTVRRRDQRVLVAPNLGWRDVDLAELVAKRLAERHGIELPIGIANDADLGALSEHLRGSALGVDDVLFICGRVGVGGGIISGGVPLRGSEGLAGELGHMVIDPSGPACHCGNQGCLEAFLGEASILTRAGWPSEAGSAGIAEVVRAATQGEPRARATLDQVDEWLGRALASLANVLNPAVIVIGGFLTDVFVRDSERIRTFFEANMRAAPGDTVDIRPPGLGLDSALLGAAEVGFARLLEDPVYAALTYRAAG